VALLAAQATGTAVNPQLQQQLQAFALLQQVQNATALQNAAALAAALQPQQTSQPYYDPTPAPAVAAAPLIDTAVLPAVSQRTPGCRHILISNISPHTPEAFLRQQLQSCGHIVSFRWIYDRRGMQLNKAIVEFDSEMATVKATAQYHGYVMHGMPMRIDYAPNGRHPEAD